MANAANTVLFYSKFSENNFRDFEFDQLLTNSFPLDYLLIHLQRFVLSGKIAVKMHFPFIIKHLRKQSDESGDFGPICFAVILVHTYTFSV